MRFLVRPLRFLIGASLAGGLLAPARSPAQTFTLDPLSTSLAAVPTTAGELLAPSGLALPSPAPPSVGVTGASLGLLPGDVIDAISYGNDAAPGSTLTFSVTRPSLGVAPGALAPDVFSEVAGVLPGSQPQAASDLFTTLDAACGTSVGVHTQVLDGDGLALAPPPSCYPGLGIGLAEGLPLAGPSLNDDVSAFEWSLPAVGTLAGIGFSLAAGSPTLTPGANPLLPQGAEPGDLLLSYPAVPPALPALFVFAPAASLGLLSAGPGCAPPACDDLDALSVSFSAGGTVLFSITPTSPSSAGCGWSPADVLGGGVPPLSACAAPFLSAASIGLAVTDDVDALESFSNPCAVSPAGDPDGDGLGACDDCPGAFNPAQDDTDGDGIGDACDPCTDLDLDGFGNPGFANVCATDLCPLSPGPNGDGDGDGFADECDNCPTVFDPTLADGDGDGIGDLCDLCPAIPDPLQTDTDLDGDGDACDPCPHVAGGVPQPMTSLKRVLLRYGATGPGGGDDSLKVIGAAFTTGVAFDPDSTDDLHVTLRDGGTGSTMFAASLTAASGFWSQKKATPKWKYLDPDASPATGVKKALLKQSPPGGTGYAFQMIGKAASVAGALSAPPLTTTLEITPGGLCFAAANSSCKSTARKDKCDP